MTGNSTKRKAVTIGLVLLIVGSGAVGAVAVFQDCQWHDSLVMAFVSGITSPNEEGVCRFNPTDTTTQLNESMSENETFDEVLRVADVRANEERLTDSLLNTPEYSKEPVRQHAELEFAHKYLNNSTETEAITAARNGVKFEYDERIKSLAARYNRDVRNARDTYAELDRDNATQYFNVYVNGSSIDTSGGVNFSVPTSLNDSANGTTYTTPNGSTVYVATVEVNGTVYSFKKDDLAITVSDPAGEQGDVPVLGKDVLAEYGAKSYNPSDDGYSATSADVVVAADGSGNYTSLSKGLNNVPDGGVIYLKDGTYTLSAYSLGKSVTIVGDGTAPVIKTASGAYKAFSVSAGNVSLDVRGIVADATVSGDYQWYHASGWDYAELNVEAVTLKGELSQSFFKGDGTNSVGHNITIDKLVYSGSSSIRGNWDSASMTNYKSHHYDSFTDQMITEQKTQRSDILSALGDSSSGYLHDVWNKLETDTLNITDILTYEQMFDQSFAEEDIGSRAWLDAQYMQAGMSGHNLQSTAIVEVQTGSTVYADAQKDNPVSITSDTQYEGHLWTMNPPASGDWQTNTTYNTSDLGGKVFVTYYEQKETTDEDGNIIIEEVPATLAIEGEFQLAEIYNENGTSVNSIQHGGTPSADPYNASEYNQQIEQLNTRIVELQEQIEAYSSSGSGSSCGISFFGLCTGLSSILVSPGMLLLSVVVLGYLFRPLMETLSALSGGR